MNNIILIGMPGCGKSTLGVLLAKMAGYEFLDSDLIIQKQENKRLFEIIESCGKDYFAKTEENINSNINATKTVIATGGSVVYSDKAMTHLKAIGTVVFLDINFEEIEQRVGNFSKRGILFYKGDSLKDLYEERMPLYKKYADIIIDCNKKDIKDISFELIEKLKL